MNKLWIPVALAMALGLTAACSHDDGMMDDGMKHDTMMDQSMSDEGMMKKDTMMDDSGEGM
jgi:hypothetical protein